jgi:hypothetical protein
MQYFHRFVGGLSGLVSLLRAVSEEYGCHGDTEDMPRKIRIQPLTFAVRLV